MKKLILAFALGVLSALASAQTAPAIEEIRISGALSRIELPDQLRNVWADEFDQVKGTYRLSNGKNMDLLMWGNRMYAKVDGQPRTQLAAASPYVFVGLDRQIKIKINDLDRVGPVTADVLMYVPRVAGHTAEVTLTRLVASR
ncbi:MAG: hypothetical protein V4631_11095 [Pseudomonadota bacterium]